jgi:hypothetical protein
MNEYAIEWIEEQLKIIDKTGKNVPFVLNPIQLKFLRDDFDNRCIVLKARQQGFSSLILAYFTRHFLLKPNTYNVVVADTSDNAEDLLDRVKKYIATWCDNISEATGTPVKPKDFLKYNSKYHLYFEQINTTYRICTAKNLDFGRSKTITNLHLSEGAFYPDLERILTGALQAVVPTGNVIIETTANGFNYFKDFYDRSTRGETGFKPLFYPASKFYDKGELWLKKKQLGRMFKQEYPESPLEAFITSGETYFKTEALEQYIELVKNPVGGNIVNHYV